CTACRPPAWHHAHWRPGSSGLDESGRDRPSRNPAPVAARWSARCPLQASVADLLQIPVDRIARMVSAQEKIAVPIDYGQQVVGVVRNATRHPAQALQLLRLPKLYFQLG